MKKEIRVVSIGPGDPDLLTGTTLKELSCADPLILRTDHHPITAWLGKKGIPFQSLDALYEQTDDFDALYDRMAEAVTEKATGNHPVYAVADCATDRSVDRLILRGAEGGMSITCVPGFSYADYFLARCRSAYSAGSIRICSAWDFLSGAYDPADHQLITEIDTGILAGDLKTALGDVLDDETEISWMEADGGEKRIPLYMLDRQKAYSHLCAAFIPASDYAKRTRYTLRDLLAIMARLRAPDGCPWDRIQTHETLRPYMVEEAWECVAAIDEKDTDHLADELGDLLFQIVFHASIGKAFDEFTMTDVITNICRKMLKRHPHVFGTAHMETSTEVADSWETIKRRETGSRTVGESLADVSPALPALKYAIKMNKKVQQLPVWRRNPAEILRDIQEEAGRLLTDDGRMNEEAMGRILFLCSHLCHRCEADSEIVLHEFVDRFKNRFTRMEEALKKQGKTAESLTFPELCVYLSRVEDGN